jgi:hypothetical protein
LIEPGSKRKQPHMHGSGSCTRHHHHDHQCTTLDRKYLVAALIQMLAGLPGTGSDRRFPRALLLIEIKRPAWAARRDMIFAKIGINFPVMPLTGEATL